MAAIMKRSYYLILLIYLIFFAISFLTNILGSINPNVSDSFKLTGTMTGMLPFSFFIAYGSDVNSCRNDHTEIQGKEEFNSFLDSVIYRSFTIFTFPGFSCVSVLSCL